MLTVSTLPWCLFHTTFGNIISKWTTHQMNANNNTHPSESADAVRHFLAFLYTGAFARDGTALRCSDLVRLGDLYDVAELKRAAETRLIKSLTGKNFCIGARLHRQFQRLFDACKAFVEGKKEEILASEWEALEKEDPAFCLKLLQHFVPVAKKPRME